MSLCRLVEVSAAQEEPAGPAHQLAPAVLQARAAGGTESRVMLNHGTLRRTLAGSVLSIFGCHRSLHQEIVADRPTFQDPVARA